MENSISFLSLIIGFFLGIIANLFTSIFKEKIIQFLFSNRLVRKACSWSAIYNTHHKKIYTCSLIQKCSLTEFSEITTKFISNKFSYVRYSALNINPRYIIFNTLEPSIFYEALRADFINMGKHYLFEEYKSNMEQNNYITAKKKLEEIIKIFKKPGKVKSFSHIKHINRFFSEKYRVQFYYFPLDKKTEISKFKNRNSLAHFILYQELINEDTECLWTMGIIDNRKIGINGIIINDSYLLDYNDETLNLFFAKNGFAEYNSLEDAIQPYYNKYLNMVYHNPNISSDLIDINNFGRVIYEDEYIDFYA